MPISALHTEKSSSGHHFNRSDQYFLYKFQKFFCLFFGLNIHYFGICPILSISFENCLLSKTVVKISFIMYDCSDFQFNPSKPIYDYNYIFYYTVFDIYIGKSLLRDVPV